MDNLLLGGPTSELLSTAYPLPPGNLTSVTVGVTGPINLTLVAPDDILELASGVNASFNSSIRFGIAYPGLPGFNAPYTPHAPLSATSYYVPVGAPIETFPPQGAGYWKLDAYTPAQGTVHSWTVCGMWEPPPPPPPPSAPPLSPPPMLPADREWRLADATGESCTAACAAAGKVCDLEGLEAVGSQAALMGVVMQIADSDWEMAGGECDVEQGGASANSASNEHVAPFSYSTGAGGSSSRPACYFPSADGTASCDAECTGACFFPTMRRICPCSTSPPLPPSPPPLPPPLPPPPPTHCVEGTGFSLSGTEWNGFQPTEWPLPKGTAASVEITVSLFYETTVTLIAPDNASSVLSGELRTPPQVTGGQTIRFEDGAGQLFTSDSPGPYHPQGASLASLGVQPAGVWQLSAYAQAEVQSGVIAAWKVCVYPDEWDPPPPPLAPPPSAPPAPPAPLMPTHCVAGEALGPGQWQDSPMTGHTVWPLPAGTALSVTVTGSNSNVNYFVGMHLIAPNGDALRLLSPPQTTFTGGVGDATIGFADAGSGGQWDWNPTTSAGPWDPAVAHSRRLACSPPASGN